MSAGGLAFDGDLRRDRYGIRTHPESRDVSYPEDGHGRLALLEDRSFWFAHRNRVIIDSLRRFPPPGPLLDVGGGNGYVTRGILDAGFPAALLEPGPAGAFNAKTLRNIPDVICATLEDAAPSPGSLGAIGCFDVFEHVEDDAALAARIRGFLMPHGFLFATVPAGEWLWSAADGAAGHFRRYRRRDIPRLLGPGFGIARCVPFFAPLVLPLFVARSLPYRLGFRTGLLPEAAEHGAGGGPGAAFLARLLRREAALLASGGAPRIGTSLLVVARKLETPPGNPDRHGRSVSV